LASALLLNPHLLHADITFREYPRCVNSLIVSGLIGLAAGVLSGLFGIGGGIIVVPALILLLGLPLREATGTSLAALLLPVGILGVLTYYQRGEVNPPVAVLLAVGLLIGAVVGAQLAIRLPEVVLRYALAGLLVVLAAQLVLKR
jgi:uncharacterized protein